MHQLELIPGALFTLTRGTLQDMHTPLPTS